MTCICAQAVVTSLTMEQALQSAIDLAGGPTAVSVALGISHQAVLQWEKCPPLRVLEVERLSGVSRHRLRPDIYPPSDRAPPLAPSEAKEAASS